MRLRIPIAFLLSCAAILIATTCLGTTLIKGPSSLNSSPEDMKALKGAFEQVHQSGGAERYFAAIDAYVDGALKGKEPIVQINKALRELEAIDQSMIRPKYLISEALVGGKSIYVASYRVSYDGPSTVRIYAPKHGTYRKVFAFMPSDCAFGALEEPVTCTILPWQGATLPFILTCGGEMSGYAPPLSMIGWTYDADQAKTRMAFSILHKSRLQAISLPGEWFRVLVTWCHYDPVSVRCAPDTEVWFHVTTAGFVPLAMYVATEIPEEQWPRIVTLYK